MAPYAPRAYFVLVRGKRHLVYGPYASRDEAARAGYFTKSIAKRDLCAVGHSPGGWNAFFSAGVNEYDDREVEYLSRHPEDNIPGCESFEVRPPEKLPMETSWKLFKKEYGPDALTRCLEGDWQQVR